MSDPRPVDRAADGDEPLLPMDRSTIQDLALRGARWTVIHTVVSLPIAFGANLVLARVLGVSDYGRLAFLSMLMVVAGGIVELGLSAALIQYGARAHAAGRYREVQHLLSAAQGFRLLVVAPLLSVLLVVVVDVEWTYLLLAIVFGVWVPAALDGSFICVIIEGKSDVSAKLAIVRNLLLQMAVIPAALISHDADVVWATRLIITGAATAMWLIPIARRYRMSVLRPRLPRGFGAGFWRFALPTGLAGLIGTLALSRTEVFFLDWLSTPENVGLFALAFGLAAHVFAPAEALVGPLAPAISGLHETDHNALKPAFQRVLRISSTVIAAACAVGLPTLAALVPLLYGSEYAPAAGLFIALGLSSALLAAGGPVSTFTSGRLLAGRLLTANVAALLVNLALVVALVPRFDAWGAVAASASGALVRVGILMVSEVRAFHMRLREVVHLAMPALFSAPIAILAWGLSERLTTSPAAAAATALVLGTGTLVVCLKVSRSGLSPQDAAVLARGLPASVARLLAPVLWTITRRATPPSA